MPDRSVFPAARVLELLRACDAADIPVYVSGGWGLDALAGRQTRDHRDLDLAVEASRLPTLVDLLATTGFAPEPDPAARSFSREDEARLDVALDALTTAGYEPDLFATLAGQMRETGDEELAAAAAEAGRSIEIPSGAAAVERAVDAVRTLTELGLLPGTDDGLPLVNAAGKVEHRVAHRCFAVAYDALATMAQAGIGTRLVHPDGDILVLHPMSIDADGAWRDPEVGASAPDRVPVLPEDARGTIDGVGVPCVPATVHVMRLPGEIPPDDRALRDRLLLRDITGIAVPAMFGVRSVTGALPAAQVATAYLRSWRRMYPTPDATKTVELPDDPDRWASDLVRDVMTGICDMSPEGREYGWLLILALVAAAADDDELGNIAAGPMEDFLSECGASVIERVEAQAVADPRFKQMLDGVWKLGMTDEVYARVRRAAGRVAPS